MLHSNDLLTIETMPSWSDISLALYKEFSEQYLIPTIFRYYLENGEIIDVRFEELFYIKDKQLKDSSVKADYIKYALIDNKGALPSRQLKLILAWCVLHQDELMQNWKLSKDGKPLNRINPLV